MQYFKIIPLGQINELLTYKSKEALRVGSLVNIPLRKKIVVGVIVEISDIKEVNFDLKKIKSIVSSSMLVLSNEHINFINQFSKYYFIQLGMAFKMSIGALDLAYNLKKKLLYEGEIFSNKKELKKKFSYNEKKIQLLIDNNEITLTDRLFPFSKRNILINLSTVQQKIFTDILNDKNNLCHLLHGVTGSGKTELYFKIIHEKFLQNKQCLILLPEISLTDVWQDRFRKYFGIEPFIWHSQQTPKQKKIILQCLINSQPCIIVGARSAVLLPFTNLGLIICDEEHDSLYKQEDGPRYNARDMAILKGYLHNSLTILVSASPSLETSLNIKKNKIVEHKLNSQFFKTELPKVEIIDMKQNKASSFTWITLPVYNQIKKTLKDGSQVLLFLNRRGHTPIKICAKCHVSVQCNNCATNLVYHRSTDKLICHYCSRQFNTNVICKNCNNETFFNLGIGLEKLKEEIERLFPNYKSEIFSSDTLNNKKNKLDKFENLFKNKTQIILGSQAISKALHVSNLKLVVIVDGDSALYNPDFRAIEKTYQLYHQVGGRAGREGSRGLVMIQSFNPNHKIFEQLKTMDAENFILNELSRRQKNMLPPYYKLCAIHFLDRESVRQKHTMEVFKNFLNLKKISFSGPIPAMIPYKKGMFHNYFFFKSENPKKLNHLIKIIQSFLEKIDKNGYFIDIDPININ